jgi:hypothetical protein
MGLGGTVSAEGSVFDDVVMSPFDQPVTSTSTSTSTDSDRSPKSNTKMVRWSRASSLDLPNAAWMQRRRAQNRASQRAFRERKERHVRNLKATLEGIGDKHRKLLETYSQQSEAVTKLKNRIAELNAQIAALSTQSDGALDDNNNLNFQHQKGCQADFDQFDAFSFSLKPSGPANTLFLGGQGQIPNPNPNPGTTLVDMFQLPAYENLPEFEDLLNSP